MKDELPESTKILLKKTYQYFNERNIDATLASMQEDVDWPNGMEGGIEHGHEAVCNYL